ncbi:413_t:CDS:2, partial [Gigaspora margarita]
DEREHNLLSVSMIYNITFENLDPYAITPDQTEQIASSMSKQERIQETIVIHTRPDVPQKYRIGDMVVNRRLRLTLR